MAETLTIISERVDDLPVLLAQLDRLGVRPLLDEYFPTHGNWGGLSLGWVSVLWLTYILSEGDHRLNGSTRCGSAPGSRRTRWMSATTDWPPCWRP